MAVRNPAIAKGVRITGLVLANGDLAFQGVLAAAQLPGADPAQAVAEGAQVILLLAAGAAGKRGRKAKRSQQPTSPRTDSSARGDSPGEVPPTRPLGARGPYSGREFDPENAGGPIRHLTTDRIRITERGIDYVEQHVARFRDDTMNPKMIQRLRDIVNGKLKPEQVDLDYYSHELRELVRYRRQGYRTGVPTDTDEAHKLWENTHTAALEDYRISDRNQSLYHPEAKK